MRHIISLTILFFVTACSSKPHIVNSTDITASTTKKIYIVNHGWHTGFVIPTDTITRQLPQLKDRFSHTPFIEFGWGDKGFYQADEITSMLTIQAIFWPTESVIHAVAVPEPVESYFLNGQFEILCLQPGQYSRLISFIENSFHKDNNGNIYSLRNGIYGDSQFYKGEGDYYLMNTCNKWTAKGLKSAGMNISTTFKLTAGSIMAYLSGQKEAQPNSVSGCNVIITSRH